MMKFLGVLLVLVGIALGAYVGIYLCLVGGIVSVINEVKKPVSDALPIVWGVVRVFLAGTIGWSIFYICVLPGIALIFED